jgi:hypothetical protein
VPAELQVKIARAPAAFRPAARPAWRGPRDGPLAGVLVDDLMHEADVDTDLGYSLGQAFCGVWTWAEENIARIEAARIRFDAAKAV